MSQVYITHHAIQEYLKNKYQSDHQEATMYDAIYALYQKNDFQTSNQVQKSFSPTDDMYNIFTRTPINVTSILHQPTTLKNDVTEQYYMFNNRDARSIFLFNYEKTYPHFHDYFEIDFVLSGSALFDGNGEHYTLPTGTLAIIGPATRHQLSPIAGSRIICISVKKSTFNEAFMNLIEPGNPLANFFKQSLYRSHEKYMLLRTKITAALINTLKVIFKESYSTQLLSNTVCCSYLAIFLSYVLRNLTSSLTDHSATNISNNLVEILNYIDHHCATITLKETAARFGYNPSYLGKIIVKRTGHSFNELRTANRIKRAKHQLLYSTDPVGKVAFDCGFSSASYFSRSFSQITHMSPRKYRNSVTP